MTSLPDRPNTALLVVDVQNAVVAGAYNRDDVIANIRGLVERARAGHVPVLWIQHSSDNLVEGSEGWAYVPELQRRDTEPLVPKKFGDAFEDTVLETELAQRGVGRVVVTGAQTDACIRGDPPRRVRTRLRHRPGRGRAHHRRPHRVRASRARQGRGAHEHVLDVAGGSRSDRERHDRRRGRVRRRGFGSFRLAVQTGEQCADWAASWSSSGDGCITAIRSASSTTILVNSRTSSLGSCVRICENGNAIVTLLVGADTVGRARGSSSSCVSMVLSDRVPAA